MSIRTEPETAPRVVVDGPSQADEDNRARRVVLALAAAGLAVLAAGVAAIGPARTHRQVYTWPPPDQGAAVEGPRYAPLLLSHHQPERLSASVPCAGLANAVAVGRETPLTLIATARRSDAVDGRRFLVAMEQGSLVTSSGDQELMRAPWPGPQDTRADCAVAVEVHEADWRVTSGGRVLGSGRELAPNVSGLYTDLPPSAGLETVVDTGTVSSSPSARQWLFNGLAVVAGVAALVLLLRSDRRVGAQRSLRTRWLRLVRAIAWIDVVVIGVLVVWWVVGPIFFDDGWVMSTVINQPASHSFSVYYDHFGLPYPFVVLPLSVLYAVSRLSTSLLSFRIPVLVVGILTWGMLRAYVGHLRDPAGRTRLLPTLTLGAMFLVGWFSWLGTLRPEPAVAVLAALVILAVRRFHHTGRIGNVAVAAIAAAAAVSVHPEGVAALAPLAVAIPALYRWARHQPWQRWCALAAIALVAAAALTLLVFADTDLALFGDSRKVFASDAFHAYTWHDELLRYKYVFSADTHGTIARRATVLLALVPIALFLTRPDRRRNPDLDLPVLSLMLGVAALVFTPSKWPWQLGVLIPFAALAAAAETHRLLTEPANAVRVRRLLLALGGTVVASMIAWRGHAYWNEYSVVDVEFGRGGSGFLHIDLSSGTPWILITVGASVVACVIALCRRSRRRRRLHERLEPALTGLGAGALGVSAALIAGVTLALFIVDGFRAPSWSLAKQNVDSVAGSTCGLADDLSVIDPARGRALPVDDSTSATAALDALPPSAPLTPPLEFSPDGVDPAVRPIPGLESQWGSRVGGDADQGTYVSPWFNLDQSIVGTGDQRGRIVTFLAGRIDEKDTRVFVQIGRQIGSAIQNVAVAEVPSQGDDPQWHPALLDSIVPIPPDVNRMRLVGVDAANDRGGWLAFSGPRAVRPEPMTQLLSRPGRRTLVSPHLRPYFPCVTQPRVEPGVSDPPDVIVGNAGVRLAEGFPGGPMLYVGDLYPVSPLILMDHSGKVVSNLPSGRVEKRFAPGTPVAARLRRL